MSTQIDIDKLSKMIKSKRGNMGLRDTAKEIGDVSASTLSRIEQGKLPDIDTFFLLCKWLNVPSDEFTVKKTKNSSNKDVIVAHLRADKTLSQETSNTLIAMIDMAYKSQIK